MVGIRLKHLLYALPVPPSSPPSVAAGGEGQDSEGKVAEHTEEEDKAAAAEASDYDYRFLMSLYPLSIQYDRESVLADSMGRPPIMANFANSARAAREAAKAEERKKLVAEKAEERKREKLAKLEAAEKARVQRQEEQHKEQMERKEAKVRDEVVKALTLPPYLTLTYLALPYLTLPCVGA